MNHDNKHEHEDQSERRAYAEDDPDVPEVYRQFRVARLLLFTALATGVMVVGWMASH